MEVEYMDRHQLEQLGSQLREIGHKRRELAHQVFHEVQEDDSQSAKKLFRELSEISDQAISIMMKQKEIFDQELQ